jgi:hypothetical protein
MRSPFRPERGSRIQLGVAERRTLLSDQVLDRCDIGVDELGQTEVGEDGVDGFCGGDEGEECEQDSLGVRVVVSVAVLARWNRRRPGLPAIPLRPGRNEIYY